MFFALLLCMNLVHLTSDASAGDRHEVLGIPFGTLFFLLKANPPLPRALKAMTRRMAPIIGATVRKD